MKAIALACTVLLSLSVVALPVQAYQLELSPNPAQPYSPVDLLVHAQVEAAIIGASVVRQGYTIRVYASTLPITVAPITYRYALGSFPPGMYLIEFYTRSASVLTPPWWPYTLRNTLTMVIAGTGPAESIPSMNKEGLFLLAGLLLCIGLLIQRRRDKPHSR